MIATESGNLLKCVFNDVERTVKLLIRENFFRMVEDGLASTWKQVTRFGVVVVLCFGLFSGAWGDSTASFPGVALASCCLVMASEFRHELWTYCPYSGLV